MFGFLDEISLIKPEKYVMVGMKSGGNTRMKVRLIVFAAK